MVVCLFVCLCVPFLLIYKLFAHFCFFVHSFVFCFVFACFQFVFLWFFCDKHSYSLICFYALSPKMNRKKNCLITCSYSLSCCSSLSFPFSLTFPFHLLSLYLTSFLLFYYTQDSSLLLQSTVHERVVISFVLFLLVYCVTQLYVTGGRRGSRFASVTWFR